MSITGCSSGNKLAFDITKSKRTRRPFHYLTEKVHEEDVVIAANSASQDSDDQKENNQIQKNDHVKLKQLINVDSEAKEKLGEDDQGRALLSEHLANENQLQLVVKQTKDKDQGVKLRKIIRRYVKAISHMVKVKRNHQVGALEKPALCLKV